MSVIITGGGMAGACLALALSHLSRGRLAVQLIESSHSDSHQHPGFDARAIALAQGTCQQLARVGVWQAIADLACPIQHVQVSDQGHCGVTCLQAQDYAIAALGYVVELHSTGRRLFSLLQRAPGVTLHCPARVAHIERCARKVSVTLDNGSTLQGQLLVAADGTDSAIAQQCGMQRRQSAYGQLAVIATITSTQPHENRAFERFTGQGPLALLPMIGNRYSLVWCHALPEPDANWRQHPALHWSDQHFCAQLQRAFGWRAGRIAHAGRRSGYPLALSQAMRMVTHRLALVGNAAQTLHPVAGQGFNLGLRDVMSLAETLTSVSPSADMGDYSLLASYERRRMADRNATIALTDGLVHLFANQWQPLVAGRNWALTAMNFISPLRHSLAHRALGWVAR